LSIESIRKDKNEKIEDEEIKGKKKFSNQDNYLERMVTITPSEPIVAEAVADLLCRTEDDRYSWTNSITTLVDNLLSRGLVEKGIKGELFARLLCVLARDFHLMKVKQRDTLFPYAQPFSVKDFLRSLFSDQWLQNIMEYTPTKPNTRMWEGSQTARFDKVFDGGYMNFTHFTHTRIHLDGS